MLQLTHELHVMKTSSTLLPLPLLLLLFPTRHSIFFFTVWGLRVCAKKNIVDGNEYKHECIYLHQAKPLQYACPPILNAVAVFSLCLFFTHILCHF